MSKWDESFNDTIDDNIDDNIDESSFDGDDYLKAPWEKDAESPEAVPVSEKPAEESAAEDLSAPETGDQAEGPETAADQAEGSETEGQTDSPEEEIPTDDLGDGDLTGGSEAEAGTENTGDEDRADSSEAEADTENTGDEEQADSSETETETENTGDEEQADNSGTGEDTDNTETGTRDEFAEEAEQERDHWWRRLGRRFTFLVYGLAVLVIVVGGFSFYYMHSRQEPVDTIKKFLGSIQILDFDTMTGLLKDQDLSTLDEADILNPAYQDFFREVNAKMAYSIKNVRYHMKDGTAKITAHIRYIDGTEIYTSVVSEFVREIVSSAFSGEMPTEEETTHRLVQMLESTAADLPETYAETEIAYPLVKTEYGWKVAVLDEQTVKVMSANFKNIEAEISRAMAQPEAEAPVEKSAEELSAEEDLPVIVEDNDIVSMQTPDVIHLEEDDYTILFDHFDLAKDYAGNDCLLYYYTYTNNRSEPSSALMDVHLKTFQNGKTLADTVPNNADRALDNYYAQAEPGDSLLICQAYLLSDRSNVSVQAAESSYDSTDVVSQVLRIQ